MFLGTLTVFLCLVSSFVFAACGFAFQIGAHDGVVSLPRQRGFWPDSTSDPAVKVQWEAGKLSIHTKGAALSEVLQAVAHQTLIEVSGAEGLNNRVILHFAGMDLLPALRELLSDVDYAIAAGPPGSASAQGTRVIIVKPVPVTSLVKIETNTRTTPGVHDKVATFDGLLAKETSQRSRLQALDLLNRSSGASEQTVISALRDALKDPDPFLNTYAVQALAGRGNADAMAALSEALHGTNPSTKLMVIENVVNIEAGLPLLREAVSDPDETVRSAAAALLKQAEAGADATRKPELSAAGIM